MKKEFIKFLKSKRLWSKFKREFEKYNDSWNYAMSKLFSDFIPSMYIKMSFNSYKTKDGCEYWSKINDQWQEHLKTLNK